jgi:uncharacterized protein YdiU (UPF0061 family)
MAPSFVRFGSFEYFYWTQQNDELKRLADYVIDRHYDGVRHAEQPYLAFLEQVARRTARLVARSGAVFLLQRAQHDKCRSGITIDYGPFAFVDAFDAAHICNHSDEHGRYAYNMQPQIAHWNLYALGQALMPLTEDMDGTKAAIDVFVGEYSAAVEAVFRAKLGLASSLPEDETLINRLIDLLHATHRLDDFWRRSLDARH